MEILVVGLVVMFSFFSYIMLKDERRSNLKIRNKRNNIIIGNSKPDQPLDFPLTSIWFSVRSMDNRKVAETLGLSGVIKTNWESGRDFALENDCVFVTPQIDGWVLATGIDLPSGNTRPSFKRLKKKLTALSTEFGEAYFFAAFMDYYCWAKAVDGKIDRLYAYDGNSDGYFSIGEPLGAERWYKLVDKTPDEIPEEDQEYWEREEITFPDPELVRKIAADWSIDPTKLKERRNLAGLGLAGILSNEDNLKKI